MIPLTAFMSVGATLLLVFSLVVALVLCGFAVVVLLDKWEDKGWEWWNDW